MNTPFKQCPHCGAHLDPGEICDCQIKTERVPRPMPGPSIGYINKAETARLSPCGGKKKAADA